MGIEAIQSARALFASGKTEEAYRTLTALFGSGPDPLAPDGALADAVGLLAEIARKFGDVGLSGKLTACHARPNDPNALYGVAYDLYEQRQYASASALLYRANAIAPGQSAILGELATSLEHQQRYAEAALLVDLSGLADADPFCAYLSGFHGIMSGDVVRARGRLPVLAGAADPQLAFMRDALAGMVARADALLGAGVTLDDRALTAWQAVLSGSLLLHSSPHGYPDPMRGRYAFVGDSPGLEREGLERLRALLAASGTLPPMIVSAPDRASRILATAASALFGVPRTEATVDVAGPALVVVWSMETVGDPGFLKAMHDHRPGQTLFVHASCWTDPFPYSPDVTTFLHQTVTCPWTGGSLRVDPETRGVVRAEPDARGDDAIAKEILAAPIADASTTSLEEVVAIARALRELPLAQRVGFGRTEGKRMHQRAGGAVPSARFL